MSDILERLGSFGADYPVGAVRDVATDAAAEIRRLQRELDAVHAELRERE